MRSDWLPPTGGKKGRRNAGMATREAQRKVEGMTVNMGGEAERISRGKIILGIQEDIHSTAEKSGWHDTPRTFGDIIALVHSELSEALEEYRIGGDDALTEIYFRTPDGLTTDEAWRASSYDVAGGVDGPASELNIAELVPNKTEGIAAELADVIIRVLDASEEYGIPTAKAMLHKLEYNKTRSYRHGGRAI